MTPFLKQVAETFYATYREEIQEIAFVFPNRRAGIFFKKYLAEIIDGPLFSPTVTTVTDLFTQLSALQPADHIYLLFTLYRHYAELYPQKESFDEFVPLGETLLNDFDDVDKYMADARQLFTNIHDLKEIDAHFGSPLTEEQVAYIRRFWKNFIPIGESDNKSHFVSLWSILYDLYERFRQDLRNDGLGYEGMIFREVAEQAGSGTIKLPYRRIVFVGLNVLNRAEEQLMNALKKSGMADFYWDDKAPTLQDEYNRAAYFLRPNAKAFPSQLSLAEDKAEPTFPRIELMGIPSAVGQAKQCEIILRELLKRQAIPSPEKALNTAIVLPDEHLLLPMLYAIPEEINPINITMGYTLANTAVAGLIDILFDLQKHIRPGGECPLFYHRNVLALLSNRYLQLSGQDEVNRLASDIRKHNKVFVSQEELGVTPLLKHIFADLKNANEACEYLLSLLVMLQSELDDADEKAENGSNNLSVIALEREFIYHYYLAVNRLKGIMQENGIEMNVATFFKLLKKLTAGIAIPFEGEPLSGLQIMGVLETRALDFENVIILSMNEGIFPVKKVAPSLIPYNLRKGFDLSTTEHQDSIYAYYFYRLINRAKNVYLLYDTRTEDMASGEVSRYVYQLKYHYRLPINEHIVGYPVMARKSRAISVPKDEYVQSQLRRYFKGGDRHLSASAINTYINCPLQFYLSYVENFQESDEVEEGIDAGVFGSIYHGVMQRIYDRMTGVVIQAEALKAAERDDKLITSFIEEAFAENYFKTKQPKPLTGQNYLVGEVIRKYVKKTLAVDRAFTPFTYLTSERLIKRVHPLGDGREIQLKGFIDRIDSTAGKMRIVDYKTGKDKTDFKSIEELFDKEKKERRKAIMQVCMYAMMVTDEDRPETAIVPAIYQVQELFSASTFDPSIKMGYSPLDDYATIDLPFRQAFNTCLQEIFDPDTPFTQSVRMGDDGPCAYCPFAVICQQSTT